MPRTVRVFGRGPMIGPLPYNDYDTLPTSVLFEASPIYETMEISLRVWGTRSYTSAGITISQTIDQTETLTITRVAMEAGGIDSMEQNSPAPTFGRANDGGIVSFTNGGPGIPNENTSLFSCAGLNITTYPGIWLTGKDVVYGSGSALPNPKQQRLIAGPSENRTFTFTQTATPPGTVTSPTESFILSAPSWSSLGSIPTNERDSPYVWGYGDGQDIDTSVWSDTYWRDYRDTHVFPALSLVTGLWTTGDMQQQFTVTLS